jgi:tetratricopeptide (TPR) repeat protein
MLAPLRDYLAPEDPKSSPLFHTTKECYFNRLSVDFAPDKPGFEEARWITSEDVNVEHLLDVITSVGANSDDVWDACADFMRHLFWHKKRLIVLGPKIERLPDGHRSKPQCLLQLSRLFYSVGNHAKEKLLLVHAFKLCKERGNDLWVARTLMFLAEANQKLCLYKRGILQAKGSLGIYERLNDTAGQIHSLQTLALLLHKVKKFSAAEAAASLAINLLSGKANPFEAFHCHHVLGLIRRSKGETKEAMNHFEIALGIASSFNWHDQQFCILYDLARLFRNQGRFSDAHAHIERAKSHAVNNAYYLGHAMRLQAGVWYIQRRLEEAKSRALHAADIYKKLEAVGELEDCEVFLQWVEEEMNNSVALYFDGELLETVLLPTPINSPFPWGAEGIGWHYLADLFRHILSIRHSLRFYRAPLMMIAVTLITQVPRSYAYLPIIICFAAPHAPRRRFTAYYFLFFFLFYVVDYL